MTRDERLAGQEHLGWIEDERIQMDESGSADRVTGLWDPETKQYITRWAEPFRLIQGGLS